MSRSKKNSKNHKRSGLDRREVLTQGLILAMGPLLWSPRRLLAAETATDDRRFLIVMHGSGGASIIDSFMALSSNEVRSAGGDANQLNCYEPAQLVSFSDSPLRAVNYQGTIAVLGNLKVQGAQDAFVRKHKQDMMVVTTESTSVTHTTAQKRSVTGNEAWSGRTIQEVVAASYGKGLPLANLLLGQGGFVEHGIDSSLPGFAKGILVNEPATWSKGLSSAYGIDEAPSEEVMAVAREIRDQMLDAPSAFYRTFKESPVMRDWIRARSDTRDLFERSKLAAGLDISSGNANAIELMRVFPDYTWDPYEAQAILACMAITQGTTCTVTLGPSFTVVSKGGLSETRNPPIGFDFSHASHRGVQSLMWTRMLSITDRMIGFLKSKEYPRGGSYWDRSLAYFATDFGRSKIRPGAADVFASGHHLNNGVLVISPMANGNKVLGGIDPKTALTYGFDPASGRPDTGRKTEEKDLFAGLLQAMNINTSAVHGAPDMRAMRRR